jgi:hypothetical protein
MSTNKEIMTIVEEDYPNGINYIDLFFLCGEDYEKTKEIMNLLIEKYKP